LYELEYLKSFEVFTPEVVSRRLLFLFFRDLLSSTGFVGDLLDYYDIRSTDFELMYDHNQRLDINKFTVDLFKDNHSKSGWRFFYWCWIILKEKIKTFAGTWKNSTLFLILVTQAVFLYSVVSFLFEESIEQQVALLKNFSIWLLIKLIIGGVISGLLFCIWLPSLIQPDIEKVRSFISDGIRHQKIRQNDMSSNGDIKKSENESTINKFWINEFDEVFNSSNRKVEFNSNSVYHHKNRGLPNKMYGLDSSNFFFVSTKIASCFPNLFISKLILSFRTRFPPGSNYLFNLDKAKEESLHSYYVLKTKWNHSIINAKFYIYEKIKNFNFGFASYFSTFPTRIVNYYLRCTVYTQDFIVEVINTLLIIGLLYLHAYLYSIFIFFVFAPLAAIILFIILNYGYSMCLKFCSSSQIDIKVYPSFYNDEWDNVTQEKDLVTGIASKAPNSPSLESPRFVIRSPRGMASSKLPVKISDIHVEDITS
jgi:hypothetical protein